MSGALPTPEQTACMFIGHCLGNVLESAKNDVNGNCSVAEILLEGRPYHGTFLPARDLEHLCGILGLRLYGDDSQLDEIFAFVQDALETNGYMTHLGQEAPGVTIALANAHVHGPRIDFVAVA